MLSTGEWIAIVGWVASAAVMWGQTRAQIAAMKEGLKSTQGSDQRQGERMGRIEDRLTAIESVDKERIRTGTGAVPISLPPTGARR